MSNEKVINYKILDLAVHYNFDIKFDFIRDHTKSYEFKFIVHNSSYYA